VYAASLEDANTLIDQIFSRTLLDIITTYSKEALSQALSQHNKTLFKAACSGCRQPLQWKNHSLTNAYATAYWVRRGTAVAVAADSFYIAPGSPASRGHLTSVEFYCLGCGKEERREEKDLLDYPEIFEHDFIMKVIASAGYEIILHRIVLSTPSFETEMSSER
jgi:hypothetical protein